MSNGQEAHAERVAPLAEAFNLPVAPPPKRQIDKLLIMIGAEIKQLAAQANRLGAKNSQEAAKTYALQLKAISKKAAGSQPDKQPVDEATQLLLKVRAETTAPVREQNARQALSQLKNHVGPDADGRASEFETRLQFIAKQDDPARRCADYFQLEREIIKADLLYREEDRPGSTWQTQMEFATEDALPRNLAKEGALKGAKLGFFLPLPGTTFLGAAIGAAAGAILEAIEKPPVSPDEWQRIGKSFVAGMRKKIDDLAYSIPSRSVDEFTSVALEIIESIHGEQFGPKSLPKTREQFGQTLMKANTEALKQLLELKRDFPPEVAPQVFSDGGRLTIAKPAPKVESVVLQGGGGKGVGYPPILEDLTKSGAFDNVKQLVGTSVGAMNAACLACGGLEDEREILKLGFIGEGYDWAGVKKKYPTVKFGDGKMASCAGQMAKLDELTGKRVAGQLESRSEEELSGELTAKLRELDDETLSRIGLDGADDAEIEKQVKALAKKVKNQKFDVDDRTSQMLTFKDLALLHQLDPRNFKELTLTGWEGTGDEGRVVYFCAKDPAFRDMPIALAARISMGLPLFASVRWNGRGPFADGGLGSNAPTEATPGLDKFYREHGAIGVEELTHSPDMPLELQEAMQKTMLMTFDQGGAADEMLHGQSRKTVEASFGERLLVMKATLTDKPINPEYTKALREDATKIHNSGLNTFQVFHGGLDTLSLGPNGGSKEEVEFAESLARMKGLEQMEQRTDQVAMVTCRNADEALSALSESEMRRMLAAGLPSGADPLTRELFQKCTEFLALTDQLKLARSQGDATDFLQSLAASRLAEPNGDEVRELTECHQVLRLNSPTREQLQAANERAATAIRRLHARLQPLLKTAVLIPIQKRLRATSRSLQQDG